MPTRPQDADAAKVTSRNLAQALRARRFARSLTQAELAEKVGISLEAYSRLERGQALPSFPTLFRLCAVLETTPDSLLLPSEAGSGNPNPPRVRRNLGHVSQTTGDTGKGSTRYNDLEHLIDLFQRLDAADRTTVGVLVEHLASRAGLAPREGPQFKSPR